MDSQKYTGIYRRTISMELDRTKKMIGEGEIYDRIKQFATDMKVSDGLSDHRIIFYFAKIRPIINYLGDRFLDPSEDDLKEFVGYLPSTGISPRSVEDYKQTLKKFYGWHLPKNKYKRACGWIKVRTNVDRLKKTEEMLTEDEVKQIIGKCTNLRDKALVSLAYDSGCRVGEILTIRIRDVEMDDEGMTLHVSGKTGERNVYVVGDSIAYVREWRKVHPHSIDGNASLFVDLVNGNPMNYDAARIAVQKAVQRAKINKRVHLHLFRHSYASRYAEVVSDSVLKSQLGWKGDSDMVEKYTHLSGQQQKNAILKANGKVPQTKTVVQTDLRTCQRCGEKNPSNANYCMKCWFPLTTEASIDLRQKHQQISSGLQDKGMLSAEMADYISQLSAEEATTALLTIIKMANKPNNKQ